MKYRPKEVLFSPTSRCNLSCPHCNVMRIKEELATDIAIRFLAGCKKAGIDRVGFTGGEPFLRPDFLIKVSREAVLQKMLFGKISTNGTWMKHPADCKRILEKLFQAGYDGNIAVSVDAFHRQDLRKIVRLINLSIAIWRRPDIVSIAAVVGSKEADTEQKLRRLAAMLHGRLINFRSTSSRIEMQGGFIRISRIALEPLGKAGLIKRAWGNKWFREDHCAGPGNIFFVLPTSDVSPCCGYANEHPGLCIGSIRKDSASKLLSNAERNRFVFTVFNSGLSQIQKRLKSCGTRFPGKTMNHCYFCNYLLTSIPNAILKKSLA